MWIHVSQDVQTESEMTLYYIYFTIILCSLLIGISRYRQINESSRFMLLLLFSTLISEVLSTFIGYNYGTNIFVYHIFMPIEFSLITYIFFIEIKYNWMKWVSLTYIIVSIYNSLFIQYYKDTFCSYMFVLQCIITTFWSLIYLKKLLESKAQHNFTTYPLFWFSIGFTIFNIINLFILGTQNTLAFKIPNINLVFRNIRFLSNYLLYIFFIIAFFTKQSLLKTTLND